jgi:hypothetical protein
VVRQPGRGGLFPSGLVSIFILLVACTLSRGVSANSAQGPVYVHGREAGAFLARPSTLVVDHEDLAFRCDEKGCTFRAVYDVRNPSDAREEALGAFYGIGADDLTATTGGVDARYSLTPEQEKAIDDAVAVFDPNVARDRTIARQGFLFGVDAHARATLVFAGHIRPVLAGIPGGPGGYGSLPPLETRHLWLGTKARREVVDAYAYALSPLRSWGGSPTIDVTVRCRSARFWAKDQHAWSESEDDTGFVARRTLAAEDASTLSFRVVREPGTWLLHGGPFAGIGGRIDEGQLRARFGYEFAVPWWVLWSGAVEANFKGTTTLIPMGEIASSMILFIPSVGLGAGVPVQFRSGAGVEVGTRAQLTVSFPILSIVLPIDLFPRAGAGNVWQVGLFAQASF